MKIIFTSELQNSAGKFGKFSPDFQRTGDANKDD